MNRDDESVFHEVRKLPIGQQDPHLREACRGDDAQLARLRRLLSAYRGDLGVLREPIQYLDSGIAAPPDCEAVGSFVGPYRIVGLLGEGGMGVVYLAEQTVPIRRHVALKLIKPGMDSRNVVARFNAERQTLALMDHPGIARVLDAGECIKGQAFFVMELIDGTPITTYCDEQHLDIASRLRLFVDVCDAIQHAHQKGVIHRDIKPKNVLVAVVDGTPIVKVIDFGVAKALYETPPSDSLLTSPGQLIGTLEYMSPEQLSADHRNTDTRTDVFGLGSLLYELLTGTTPFHGERLRRASVDEMLRIIREEEPSRPSRRLTEQGGIVSGPSADRLGSSSPRARRRLGYDLDWIVMRALEKDPCRRYDAVSEFASDVRRYLRHEPVLASPPSIAYRLSKLYRRHRVVALASLAVVMALVAGVGTAVTSAIRERESARLAELASRDAEIAGVREREAQLRNEGAQRLAEHERQLRSVTRGDRERASRNFADAMHWYRQALTSMDGDAPVPPWLGWRIMSCFDESPRLAGIHDSIGYDVAGGFTDFASLDASAQRWSEYWKPLSKEKRHRVLTRMTSIGPVTVERNSSDQVFQAYQGIVPDLTPIGKKHTLQLQSQYPRGDIAPDGAVVALFEGDIRKPGQAQSYPPRDRPQETAIHLLNLLDKSLLPDVVTIPYAIGRLEFSPDSRRILVSPRWPSEVKPTDQSVAIAVLRSDPTEVESLQFHLGAIDAAFSPDGRLVAVLRKGSLETWNLTNGERIAAAAWSIGPHATFSGLTLRFSPDGSLLLTSTGKALAVWRTLGLKLIETIPTKGVVWAAESGPDNTTLVLSSSNGCTVWDLDSNTERAKLPEASSHLIRFSDHGRYLVLGSRVLDLQPHGGVIHSPADRDRIWNAISPGKSFIVSNGPVPMIRFLNDGREIPLQNALPVTPQSSWPLRPNVIGQSDSLLWDKNFPRAVISRDSRSVAGFRSRTCLQVWNTATGQLRSTIHTTDELSDAAFDDSGDRVVVVTKQGCQLYDAATGRPSGDLIVVPTVVASKSTPNPEGVTEAVFSRDGSKVIGTTRKSVYVWDSRIRTLLWQKQVASPFGTSRGALHDVLADSEIHVSPNDDFVTFQAGACPIFLELDSGKPIIDAFDSNGGSSGMTVSNDGRFVATTTLGGPTRIWSIPDRRQLPSISAARSQWCPSISADNRLLVTSGNKTLTIWDLQSGDAIWSSNSLYGGAENFRTAFFSRDGREIHAITPDGLHFSRKLPDRIDSVELDALYNINGSETNVHVGDIMTIRKIEDAWSQLDAIPERQSALQASDEEWHVHEARAGESNLLRGTGARKALFHLEKLLLKHPDDAGLKARRDAAKSKLNEEEQDSAASGPASWSSQPGIERRPTQQSEVQGV
jgi:serine/threonine protein kinase/WD40 repeat protein